MTEQTRQDDAPADGDSAPEDHHDDQQDDHHEAARATPRGFVHRHWLGIVLVLLPAAATGVAAVLYFTQYRPALEVNQSATAEVLRAATDGTTALLTYSPSSVDADTTRAKELLTGSFLDYYTQFTNDVIIPAAKDKEVETGAEVARSGIVEVQPEKAVVLLFVNQTSSSAERPEPANTASTVRVTLERKQGTWLISAFDPV